MRTEPRHARQGDDQLIDGEYNSWCRNQPAHFVSLASERAPTDDTRIRGPVGVLFRTARLGCLGAAATVLRAAASGLGKLGFHLCEHVSRWRHPFALGPRKSLGERVAAAVRPAFLGRRAAARAVLARIALGGPPGRVPGDARQRNTGHEVAIREREQQRHPASRPSRSENPPKPKHEAQFRPNPPWLPAVRRFVTPGSLRGGGSYGLMMLVQPLVEGVRELRVHGRRRMNDVPVQEFLRRR